MIHYEDELFAMLKDLVGVDLREPVVWKWPGRLKVVYEVDAGEGGQVQVYEIGVAVSAASEIELGEKVKRAFAYLVGVSQWPGRVGGKGFVEHGRKPLRGKWSSCKRCLPWDKSNRFGPCKGDFCEGR